MTSSISVKLAAVALSVALVTCPALAEEAEADQSWTGAYLGIGLGGGHLSTEQYSPPQLTYGGYDAASYSGWHPYGVIQGGLDLQLGTTVLGVRLQHAVTNSDGDSFLKVDELVSSNAVALTTLAGRAGYLFAPELLGYVTAGAVLGQFNYASVDERWGLVDDSLDATRVGVSLGAGVEHRLAENVSIFAEYTHVTFATGSATFDYGDTYPSNWTYEYTHQLGTVQAGINFRF